MEMVVEGFFNNRQMKVSTFSLFISSPFICSYLDLGIGWHSLFVTSLPF